MTPESVIDAYVNDVAERLPRAKRNDVAQELNALLRDELQGRAAEAGRTADEAMALDLVRAFGAPEDVADTYRGPGFVIVPPARASRFAALAFGGVALQWLITLPPVLPRVLEPGREFVALGGWWLTHGLGALWWPGFMVTAATIAGWVRQTWPPKPNAWRPHGAHSDQINRPLWAFGAAAAACGIALVFAVPWIFDALPAPLNTVFALNPDFTPVGGALVALLWSANVVLFALVFSEGRWRPLTRHLELALNSVWGALLLWLILGAHMFVAANTDQGAKSALGLVLLFVVIDLAVKVYRMLHRPQPPSAVAALAKH